jgi:hypothetical protein
MIGIPLGLLIGLVSGLVVLLLIRTAWRISRINLKSLGTLLGHLLAIPTFWLSGPWISGRFLEGQKLAEILPYYIVSLACTFSMIAAYPLLRIVVSLGREIGKAEVHGRAQ